MGGQTVQIIERGSDIMAGDKTRTPLIILFKWDPAIFCQGKEALILVRCQIRLYNMSEKVEDPLIETE